MTIKHLVLGGGGAGGFAIYGAIKELSKQEYYDINNIETIYGTSIGSLIAIYVALKHSWDTIDDYLIKRPWNNVISITPLDILNIWHDKGVLDENTIKLIFKPLFEAKDLSEDITLEEFYNYSGIELHIYTTNINELLPTKIDISHKTHPTLKVYKAAAMSAAIPVIFMPIYDNSCCYIDGGLLNNFPLNDCIERNPNTDEILGIKIIAKRVINYIDKDSILLNYAHNLLMGMAKIISPEHNQQKIKNIVECKLENNTFNSWNDALVDNNIRANIIEMGEKSATFFLEEQIKEQIKEQNLETLEE
jgi:predicted acylesterase/phospholipase RssA